MSQPASDVPSLSAQGVPQGTPVDAQCSGKGHASHGSTSDGSAFGNGLFDIVVFDGVCVLCSGWVHFLLRFDTHARYRFAAMQSDAGRALLAQHGLDPNDPVSFLLVSPTRAWTDSDAILRVLTGLGGLWRIAGALRVLPRAVRDPLYRMIARNRYRIFGKRDQCLMPDAQMQARFLS